MKLLVLMIVLAITIFTQKSTECSEIDKNNFSIENLSEDNLIQHTSKIQRRSLLRLFGLKPKYRPIQVNWRKSTQQRYIPNNNNNNHFNHATAQRGFFIQKNVFIYNGVNAQNHQQTKIIPSTTPNYRSTTENIPTTKSENTPRTSIDTSTQASTTITQFIQNDLSTKTYEIMTSTTSKPETYKPISVIPSTEPTTTQTSNSLSIKNTQGGFTSTSMPQKDVYSELIYDIDPRYRK